MRDDTRTDGGAGGPAASGGETPGGPSREEVEADAVEAEQVNLPTLDPEAEHVGGDVDAETGEGGATAAGDPPAGTAADETDDPAAEPGEGDAVAAAPARSGRLARWFADARLGWLVASIATIAAVLALIAAIILAAWWAPLHSEARAREEVRVAATEFALQLSTFSGATIDKWVTETQQLSTGTYAEQVEQLFDQALRDALSELEVESQGELVNLFVQSLDGGEAEVFAVVRQEVTNAAADEPFTDELRLEMAFTREGGEWLASDVAVLGPGQATVPAPAVPEEGAGDPAAEGDDEAGQTEEGGS